MYKFLDREIFKADILFDFLSLSKNLIFNVQNLILYKFWNEKYIMIVEKSRLQQNMKYNYFSTQSLHTKKLINK